MGTLGTLEKQIFTSVTTSYTFTISVCVGTVKYKTKLKTVISSFTTCKESKQV